MRDPSALPPVPWVNSPAVRSNVALARCALAWLARISDLVDSDRIEVIAYAACTTVELGAGPGPTLFLAGSADALALAHERIAGSRSPVGQWRSVIGHALCMPDKARLQLAEPLQSVVILPQLHGLDDIIARIGAGTYPEFRSGKPPGVGPRTLLFAHGGLDDLRLLTGALHANEVPFSGFVYCQLLPLWSAPFLLGD